VLAAELAVAAEPVEEEARAGGDDLRWLEGDLFVALGGVVGVEGLEGGVERGRKDVERCGQGVELDEPTVATLGAVGEEVKRRGGVGAGGGAGGGAQAAGRAAAWWALVVTSWMLLLLASCRPRPAAPSACRPVRARSRSTWMR